MMRGCLMPSVCNHPPRAPRITEVFWLPPSFSWTKCNTNGAALGCPGQAASAGVFRDNNAIFLGGFTVNLGINTDFHDELIGVIYAIEITFEKGWWNL
ncbi:hypothetical protein TSUD_328260 [Trifolium subterraneum]|uniref:RNase H type-1 domain-containing protein n=1 Tax=Trifolium subterraneum TaxID=3900 RepID=A0A2Z6M1T1_TRISU|nr:hypothetical protein TSUD_328260 [Trifolium subterraneum]